MNTYGYQLILACGCSFINEQIVKSKQESPKRGVERTCLRGHGKQITMEVYPLGWALSGTHEPFICERGGAS